MNNRDYLERADQLIRSRKFKEAFEILDNNLDMEIDVQKEVYVLKGLCFQELLNENEAIQYFDKAIEHKNVAAFNFKGNLIKSTELFEQALLLNDNPIVARDYFNQAFSYLGLENYQSAICSCDKAIELDPYFVRAYHCKGVCFYYLDRLDDSIESYSKAIELEQTMSAL